jgi:hypothetical protein
MTYAVAWLKLKMVQHMGYFFVGVPYACGFFLSGKTPQALTKKLTLCKRRMPTRKFCGEC